MNNSKKIFFKCTKIRYDKDHRFISVAGLASAGTPVDDKRLEVAIDGEHIGTETMFMQNRIADDPKCSFKFVIPLGHTSFKEMIKLSFTIISEKENIHHTETIQVQLTKSGFIKIANKDKRIPKRGLVIKFKSLTKHFLNNSQCSVFWILLKLLALFSKNNDHITDNLNNIGLLVHNLDHVDRPEKLSFYNSVSETLKSIQFNLVCLHHSKTKPSSNFKIIQFLDEKYTSWSSIIHLARLYKSDPVSFLYTFELAKKLRTNHEKAMGSLMNQSAVHKEIIYEFLGIAHFIYNFKPSRVLLWHQWNSYSAIGNFVAKSAGIPTLYTHEGFLPGSMAIDHMGEIGQSKPCLINDYFSDKPSDYELDKAEKYIDFIIKNKNDRKPNSNFGLEKNIINQIRDDYSKVIFFAGVNDWQTGIFPLDGPYKQYQSPYYLGTYDCLRTLIKIAQEENYLIVFKPHPNTPQTQEIYHKNLLTLEFGSIWSLIESSDLVVSPLSTVLYHASITGKPSLAMGKIPSIYIKGNHYINSDAALRNSLLNKENMVQTLSKDDVKKHIATLLSKYLCSYHDWSKPLHIRDQNDYVRSIFENHE